MTQTRKQHPPRCAGAVVFDEAGRVLLVQRANDPSRGMWSIPGGRVEPGESTAEAAARECAEETGLRVEVGRLLGSVMIGDYLVDDYAATVAGGELRAGDDALDARWFTREEMDALPLSPMLVEHLVRMGVFER